MGPKSCGLTTPDVERWRGRVRGPRLIQIFLEVERVPFPRGPVKVVGGGECRNKSEP